MKNDIQSIRGQQILTALITVCQNHNNQATLQQLMKEVPEFMLEEIPESEISEVLRAYTSYEQGCAPEPGKIACVFFDNKDGTYTLIADEETQKALKGQKNSYVDPDVVASVPDPAKTQAESELYVAEAKIDDSNAVKENQKAAENAQAAASAGVIDPDADADAEKIAEAEDKIEEEKQKIEEHKQQIREDSTEFMKSIHDMEIHHDENVIDRKEREIEDLKNDH